MGLWKARNANIAKMFAETGELLFRIQNAIRKLGDSETMIRTAGKTQDHFLSKILRKRSRVKRDMILYLKSWPFDQI